MYRINHVYTYETPYEKGERYTLEATAQIVACDMYTDKYIRREIEQGIPRPSRSYQVKVIDRLTRYIYHLVEAIES